MQDNAARRALARRIHAARSAAGMTQTDLADHMGCTQSKIQKIEAARVGVKADELRRMLQVLGVAEDEFEDMVGLAERLTERRMRSGLQETDEFALLTDLETEAATIRGWHTERIPGPLQSERYMLKQFQLAWRPGVVAQTEITERFRRRKARTEIFTVADPPAYRAILSPSCLDRLPGGRTRDLVVDQVEHLLALIERHDNLELRVLPYEAPLSHVHSGFTVLDFTEADRDFAYIELPGDARTITSASKLAAYRAEWERISAAALDTETTADFLRKITTD
ncbi:helix-turn-helix domain-containing protein [Actinokineospora sp. G85]|uniref:helix-turn-helix domain-containing protein n=1 Tax=Actinokineospora sp. G85 TaxID=3406626 RepID=UPI003C77EAE8